MRLSARHRSARVRFRRWTVPTAAALPWILCSVAHALDGSADVRQSDQHARSDEFSFRSTWRRESVTARHALSFSGRLRLEARIRGIREHTGGDDEETVESTSTTRAPEVSASYRTIPLSLGIQGGTLERRTETEGGFSSEVTRQRVAGWLNARFPSRTNLTSNIARTTSENTDISGNSGESRQTSGFLLVEQDLTHSWLARYRLSGLSGDITSLGSHREQTSHQLELRGSPRAMEGRFASSFRLRSQLFDQHREWDTGEEAVFLETPLSAGLTYDDTPEALDPLEGSVLPAPGLADGDRATPTTINIGDSAPPVREFGGDYRNLQFDFGETRPFVSAVVYVDERLLQPDLFRWLVYVSDDPEGRIWDVVGDARARVTYQEWGALLQGWEVQFTGDVAGRYLKLVDVKFGVTIPDLFVTELEVFTRTDTGHTITDDRTTSHILDASLSYDLPGSVRLGYQTSLRRRVDENDDGDLTGAAHTFTTRWADAEGRRSLYGRLDRHTLEGPARAPSDVWTLHLAASRGESSDRSSTISYTHSADRSAGRDYTTDTYSLLSRWRPAPRLRITQRASHGRRNDQQRDSLTRSLTLAHTVRSNPLPVLTMNLDRTDRWTSHSAGSGFEPFHDTELDVIWALAPRLSVSADLLVRERRETDWSTRQAITWSPLPGRKLETHISGNRFYDSRTRVRRLGVDVSTTWKPRRALVVDGSVGVQRYEVGGVRSSPINTYVRLGWTF